jgi:hypothetical protein
MALPDANGSASPSPNAEALEKLSEHYQRLLEGGNQGYSNILASLRSAGADSPQSTDLFKDACLYVALRDEIDTWVAEEDKNNKAIIDRQAASISNQELLSRSTNALTIVQQNTLSEFRAVQDAYRSIFGYRFGQHGLDSATLFGDLEKVSLPNAGPELRIPDR